MDRGKYYGDGFFESIFIRRGEIPLLQFHFERIQRTLRFLQFSVPQEVVSSAALENYLLDHTPFQHDMARCRLDIWREGSGKYLPVDESTGIAVRYEPVSDPYRQMLPGITAGVCDMRIAYQALSAFKTVGKLPQVLMAREVATMGWQDGVVVNTSGSVAELVASNLFLILPTGEIHTPPVSSGCLQGVFREFLLDTHGQELGITVCDIPLCNLERYVAAFGTNAIQGIIPINNLAGRTMKVQFIEPIFELIKKSLSGK